MEDGIRRPTRSAHIFKETPYSRCGVFAFSIEDTIHGNCLTDDKSEANSVGCAEIPCPRFSRLRIQHLHSFIALRCPPPHIKHESSAFVYHTFRSCIRCRAGPQPL
jgi:hypothetical protein